MLEFDFDQSVGYWTIMTARALERALNEELAPHGITYPQCQVVAWLALEGEMSQKELAERMHVEAPTLAGILERMERHGWIRRQTSPTDQRKKLVRPTPKVKPVWDKMVKCAHRVRARATEGIDPKKLEQMLGVMASIQKNLEVNQPVQLKPKRVREVG